METSPTRVLILDDEAPIRRQLQSFLEDYDEFAVRVADSAEQALDELGREPADVAVVDMRLPGMSGEAFILAAGRAGLCRRYLLHTGSMDMVLSEELRGLGVTEQDVFLKPADMSLLLERMQGFRSQKEK